MDGQLRIAHEFKLPLGDVLGWRPPLTHRQCEVLQAWLLAEWNRPSRADHYAMQTARETALAPARVWAKDGGGSSSWERDFRVKFAVEVPKPVKREEWDGFGPRRLTKQDIANVQKQMAVIGLLGPVEASKLSLVKRKEQ